MPWTGMDRRTTLGGLLATTSLVPLLRPATEANDQWPIASAAPMTVSPDDFAYHKEDAARLDKLLRAAVPPPALFSLRDPTEIDVVISGGGLKGYFLLGARHAISQHGDLTVSRYSGTSAGAWTAMFMATELSSSDWLATFTLTAKAAQRAAQQGKGQPLLMEAYRETVWPWLKTVLPADAHVRCSDKLHVTITSMEGLKLRPRVVSHFESNEDLFEACVASSCVPMITQRGVGSVYQRKRSFDGLFSGENVPCFTDDERPQLVFDLRRIPYARTAMVLPVDPAIEAMAVNGALQTSRFLDGRRGDPRYEVVSWQGWRGGPEYPRHRVAAARVPAV